MKGRWRKKPVHCGRGGGEICPICGLKGKYKDGSTYDKEKPCPRCGWKETVKK